MRYGHGHTGNIFYLREQILPVHFNGNGVDFYGVQISAKICPILIGMHWQNPLSKVEYFPCVIVPLVTDYFNIAVDF